MSDDWHFPIDELPDALLPPMMAAVTAAASVPVDPASFSDADVRRAQEEHLAWLAWSRWIARRAHERRRTSTRAKGIAHRALSAVAVRECGVVAIGRAPSVERVEARQPTGGSIEELAARGRALLVPLGVAAGAGRELWDEECDTCIELPAEVGSGRYVALPVTGDSMSPAMHDGDTVLVKLGAPAVRGAIVVARHPEHGYVVKRVGRIDVDRLELLSLNPEFAPMHIPCDARLVLGQVVLRWCAHATR